MQTYPILKHMLYIRKLYDVLFSEFRTDVNLNQTEVDILGFLSNHPDMNTSVQIAEYRMIPKANISKAVDVLCQKGLLAAERDEGDRRRVRLRLTAQAESVVKDIQSVQQQYGSALTKDFSDEEMSIIISFMERMTNNAQEMIKENQRGNQ